MVTLGMEIDDMKAALAKQGERLAKYRSIVPAGHSGPWRIEEMQVEFDLGNLRMIRDGRGCAPGTYKRLVHDKRGIVMSDTDAEIADFLSFVLDARGHVAVAGLGLGVVTQALLARPEVKHVTVVEIDRDVIKLVKPYLECDRLTVVRADIFKWVPSRKFDWVWFDIWDDICGDHVVQIDHLKDRYKAFARKRFAWCEREMRNQ